MFFFDDELAQRDKELAQKSQNEAYLPEQPVIRETPPGEIPVTPMQPECEWPCNMGSRKISRQTLKKTFPLQSEPLKLDHESSNQAIEIPSCHRPVPVTPVKKQEEEQRPNHHFFNGDMPFPMSFCPETSFPKK